jgi:acetyl/propionyl-CoA carboxylase alpha subunit
MALSRLLIANRGEIAIRIARAAAGLGIPTVALYSEDDERSLHVRKADAALALAGRGPAAYLDAAQVLAAARNCACDAIHPGYGFLSEDAGFARRCEQAGLKFVGPASGVVALFGDKLQARALARRCNVRLLDATEGPTSLAEVRRFFADLGPGAAMMIKAVVGGGGRGMRAVLREEDIEEAWTRCRAEMAAAGTQDVYAERLMPAARHIEVQIVGDGQGRVVHLGERECTLQRRHQKLVEVAPSPALDPALRERLLADAVRMAQAAGYEGLGTFEFLVDAERGDHAFIEANPRLQVEHTVTEAVTGVDLVQTQLRIAAGTTLPELGLEAPPRPSGYAVQCRINAEIMAADGTARPASGELRAFDPPGGPGVRVDTYAYAGYAVNPHFDTLLAKLIVHAATSRYAEVLAKARHALREFRIEGIASNADFLVNLLGHPEVIVNRVTTRFVEEHAGVLVQPVVSGPMLFFSSSEAVEAPGVATLVGPPGSEAVTAPMPGVVVELALGESDRVRAGDPIAVIEAMKMQHRVVAPVGGLIRHIATSTGAMVEEGEALVFIEPDQDSADTGEEARVVDLDAIRADLAEVRERHALTLDERRPEAVARRRRTGQRTARENLADLLDPDSFVEYGALAIAAQRGRRSLDDLVRNTPADGLIGGTATINAGEFGAEAARCLVLAYDFTVLAGTQGVLNHKKTDRLLQLAEEWHLPVVLFAEGGGGRPGDTDWVGVAGLDCTTFHAFARLSGLVPRVGIVSGRCFAGNAALLGCCDVIIAARDATIGMGGPAMIEGGGLGVHAPEDVGPVSVQAGNGVIDIVVRDEAEAVRLAKQYLAYFQGATAPGEHTDPRELRHLIPEKRVHAYDIRKVTEALADTGSVLELRRAFGVGIVTALVRIAGRPLGLIANNPMHLGGAIDADAADKAARFMQLCDAFGLPIVSLCDTPGFMVGPAAEKTAMVRHVSRLFLVGASLSVPLMTIVLRKGYGLGAQAMAGGSFQAPLFIAAWPSGEFGAMGLEGAVRLGFRKELEAVTDPAAREALYQRMVEAAYERGKAINMASFLEIDDVIDPAETRERILRSLDAVGPRQGRGDAAGRRPFVDAW